MGPRVRRTGVVPVPTYRDPLRGGHAVLAVGYDHARRLITFRNSWGSAWGDRGYGYLPYAFFASPSLTWDFWDHAASLVRPPVPLSPGIQIVGRFEIVAPLGAGSMGEVYQAHDLKLRRDVALKLLSQALATSAEHLLRFEREARAASALNHPHICTIYDVGCGA